MAKQNTAQSSLIGASAALAQSQIPGDYAAEFMKTFGAATSEFEAERKAQQNEVKEWLGNLKTDIDFTSMSPEMEAAVRETLTTGKNEYAELANLVAKTKDPSSMEYKNAVDRMNEINREFQTLAKEVATYNQEKVNITNGIQSDQYSLVNDFSLYKNIYGLQDSGVQSVTINGGHLIFNGTRYDSLKNPIGVSELPGKVAEKAVFYDSHNYAMTTREENAERIALNNAFKDNNAFGAFLLDIPAELEEIRMKEISDAYITAKKDGTLNDKIEGLKSQATDMIIQAYKDAALAGKARYDTKLNNSNNPNNLDSRYKKPETVQAMIQAQEDAIAEGVIIGAQEPPNLAEDIADYNSREENVKKVRGSSAKIFKFGPSDNPDQIRIKLDPTTKKWVYFNSKSTVKSEYNNLLELMNSHPGLFYINKQ